MIACRWRSYNDEKATLCPINLTLSGARAIAIRVVPEGHIGTVLFFDEVSRHNLSREYEGEYHDRLPYESLSGTNTLWLNFRR